MTAPIIVDGYRWIDCPACGGDGYTETLDHVATKAWHDSPTYCKVACGCEDGLAPLGCEDCGEHLTDEEGDVCASCVAAAAAAEVAS